MNKLGFGFLHLPVKEDETIDLETLNTMVDTYLAGGRTYFDTAYTYSDGKSEWALRESLVKRHPRDSFQILLYQITGSPMKNPIAFLPT